MTVKITPLDHAGEVVELSKGSNVFEKQVLPWGKFNYKGTSFEITPEWADHAIKAHEERAFDQAVFALADENNSHHVDERPDRFGGEVLKFVKRSTGLNAIIKLTNKTAGLVRENKKLGVSVRFHNGYIREADGRSWPVAIDQVLGTTNPRITGMAPWKQIALSNVSDGESVEDSSNGEWNMPEKKKEDATDPVTGEGGNTSPTEDKVTLTKDEYEKFKAMLAANENNDDDGDDDGDTDIDDIITELEGDGVGTKQPAKVGLSAEAKRIIQLSNEIAKSNYERDALAWKQAGVPPAIVALAAPVLKSYDEVNVVTLSNDGKNKTVDARQVVREILDACKGTVKLSQEEGHVGRSTGAEQDEEFKAAYKNFLDEANQF